MAIRIKSEEVKGTLPITFRKGGKPHYKIRIYLISDDPSEIDQIVSVQYELDPSFKDSLRSTSDRRKSFEITIRTYGYFDISADLTDINGNISTLRDRVKF